MIVRAGGRFRLLEAPRTVHRWCLNRRRRACCWPPLSPVAPRRGALLIGETRHGGAYRRGIPACHVARRRGPCGTDAVPVPRVGHRLLWRKAELLPDRDGV